MPQNECIKMNALNPNTVIANVTWKEMCVSAWLFLVQRETTDIHVGR